MAQGTPNPNDAVGSKVEAPAGLGDVVSTPDWRVELREVIQGQDVFDRSGLGTQALGEADPSEIPNWVAFRVAAEAVGGGRQPVSFPPNAFALVDETGAPVPDVMTLSPPAPDVSGACFPGATREGWTALALPEAMPTVVVRFLPYATLTPDPAPRFFQLVPALVKQAAGGPFAAGAPVVVTEATVNLRDRPSTGGAVVAPLDPSQALVVDGAATAQDGYDWYPVHVASTGQRGFVAGDFLAAQP